MFNTKKVRELTREVERLEHLVKAHENAYNELVAVYEKRDDELLQEARSQPAEIDFYAMRAFSVERIMRKGIPTTIIGYKYEDRGQDNSYTTQIKEWSIYCNEAVHADIIRQYKEYRERMNKRTPWDV